jgi:hypothetical protein
MSKKHLTRLERMPLLIVKEEELWTAKRKTRGKFNSSNKRVPGAHQVADNPTKIAIKKKMLAQPSQGGVRFQKWGTSIVAITIVCWNCCHYQRLILRHM